MKPASMRFLFVLALLLGALSMPVLAAGSQYTLDPDHTQVSVHWNHLGFSNPGATFRIGQGTLLWNGDDPSQSSVTVTIPVASVDTQVPALDARFKSDFFQVKKYPNITFKSTGVNRIGQSGHYRIKGDLTVHGVTKPVILRATLNKIGEEPMFHAPAIGFDAKTTIKRSEFGLGAYVPMVSDLVHIRITTEAIEAKAFAKAMKTHKKPD